MEIREWRRLATYAVGMLGIVLIFSILCFVRHYGNFEHTVHAKNPSEGWGTAEVQTIERQEATALEEKEVVHRSDVYIEIPKKEGMLLQEAYLEYDYMDFSVCLNMKGKLPEEYTEKDIVRVCRGEQYAGQVKTSEALIQDAAITKVRSGLSEIVSIHLRLKDIYEPSLYETPQAYYITLVEPETIYDKIVVVDAGHGGMDEGTISQDGRYREKDCTLQIVRYLKELLDKTDWKVYYTRLDDVDPSKASRTGIANAVDADVFVSVHCNASDPGDTTACGLEALYSSKKNAGSASLNSRQLAENVLEQLGLATGRKVRGTIRRNDLYLMNHSEVPVTIIETGYMSNTSDLKFLLKEKNQKKIAKGIYQGIEKSLSSSR